MDADDDDVRELERLVSFADSQHTSVCLVPSAAADAAAASSSSSASPSSPSDVSIREMILHVSLVLSLSLSFCLFFSLCLSLFLSLSCVFLSLSSGLYCFTFTEQGGQQDSHLPLQLQFQ